MIKIKTTFLAILALITLTIIEVKAQTVKKTSEDQNLIFPKGQKAPAANFTGTVWVSMLVTNDSTFHCSIGNVTFEPGARSNWHSHPAGQILLITDGLGYYQEKGQPIKLMRKGDVVTCLPDVEHWHGASPKSSLTHIATNPNTQKGVVVWRKPVTDKEYNSLK
jgi:quercetin dioxygenase-like cupin family protein